MMLISLPRLLKSEITKTVSILGATPKLSIIPSASITSKENRDPSIKKPAPWPYETKKFTYFHAYIYSTIKYFDENTKVIVVDGNIAAGKTSFTKALADAFDMKYIPEANVDIYYTTPYGYDLRKIDELVPPSYKVCELKEYYQNPYNQNVAMFQFRMFLQRYYAYIKGLNHVLNTGQGLVMERSVYSDFVFLEAMFKAGYLSKPVRELYYDILGNTLDELLRPHLVVYLDISPEVALERIKKRNDPIEKDSPVLTKEYLESIDHFYKRVYLKEAAKHSEVLVYDWSNYGDVEVVVEDIERIDFERFTKYDSQCKDWRQATDWDWSWLRRTYGNQQARLLNYSNIFRPSVSEVFHPPNEVEEYRNLLHQIPGEIYIPGFNPMAGDNVWFKTQKRTGGSFLRVP